MKVCIIVIIAVFQTTFIFSTEKPSHQPYLDFKRTNSKGFISGRYVWNVTASPGFSLTTTNQSFLVNIGNSQIRLSPVDVVNKGISLGLKEILMPDFTSLFWVGETQPDQNLMLTAFTLRLGNEEVVSWTKYIVKKIHITSNFRVYMQQEQPVAFIWVTEHYTKTALENLYNANSKTYGIERNGLSEGLEEDRFLRSISGPIWVMLTNQSGCVFPRDMRFPSLEDLIAQESVSTALSEEDYLASAKPVWQLPFLYPPVLKIKRDFDNDETKEKLKSLQREVTLSVIRSGAMFDTDPYSHLHYSRDRMMSNEKLLRFYLDIIEPSSAICEKIASNLEKVHHEVALRAGMDSPPSEQE